MSVFRKYKLKFKIDNRLGLGLIFASQNSGLKLPLLCRAKASPGFLIIPTSFLVAHTMHKHAESTKILKDCRILFRVKLNSIKNNFYDKLIMQMENKHSLR